MREYMLKQLAKLSIVFQSGHSSKELALLEGIFAETFEREKPDTLDRAFVMHMKNCKRFPTPAHIAEFLLECRPRPVRCGLPERSGKIIPGFGMTVYLEWRARRER